MYKFGLECFTIPFFPPRKRKNYVTNLKYILGHLIKKKMRVPKFSFHCQNPEGYAIFTMSNISVVL